MGFLWQLLLFAVLSVLCLFFVRPVMLRYFHRNDPDRKSNADALIGQEGRVSETIVADGYGRVAIDGDDWKAVSADGREIAKGSKVRVVSRDSIIITVQGACGQPRQHHHYSGERMKRRKNEEGRMKKEE